MKNKLYETMHEIETKCTKWDCSYSDEIWQEGEPCPIFEECDTMDFRGFWEQEGYCDWKNGKA